LEDEVEGSLLREAFKKLIVEVINDLNAQGVFTNPEEGSVVALNDDGSIDVQTSSNFYPAIGAATQYTIGAYVLVITGDGQKVAVPR
jgi:hypothetical protein